MASKVRSVALLSAVVMLSLVARAAAQQNPPPRAPLRQQGNLQRVTANKVAADGVSAQINDETIAKWLSIGNQAEIAVSQMAESKTKNKDVRQFAEMMVKDHTQMEQQLEKFGAMPIRFNEQQGKVQQNANGAGINFLAVERQIAERCVASAQKELNDKQGTERDECYIGMQIAAHQRTIDTQKALRAYASPDFQAAIDKATATAESHLDHAKQLIRTLAGQLSEK